MAGTYECQIATIQEAPSLPPLVCCRPLVVVGVGVVGGIGGGGIVGVTDTDIVTVTKSLDLSTFSSLAAVFQAKKKKSKDDSAFNSKSDQVTAPLSGTPSPCVIRHTSQ